MIVYFCIFKTHLYVHLYLSLRDANLLKFNGDLDIVLKIFNGINRPNNLVLCKLLALKRRLTYLIVYAWFTKICQITIRIRKLYYYDVVNSNYISGKYVFYNNFNDMNTTDFRLNRNI